MPVMGGLEAYREMKKIRPDLRVLVTTGFLQKDEAQCFLDEGARSVVPKPFTLAEIASRVAEALSS
jgi:CheY-like chemotaxis protein